MLYGSNTTDTISLTMDSTTTSGFSPVQDRFSHSFSIIVIIGCLSGLSFLVNLIVLVASKFTSSGRTPTLIFVRSLCVADIIMAGFGGLTTLLATLQPVWINCFIGESLMFSSMLASIFTLFAFTVDLYRELIGENPTLCSFKI